MMKRNNTRKTRQEREIHFSDNNNIREYAIPNFSNLFNTTNNRNINEGIALYYNERLPFSNLISSKGQTIKGETKHTKNARKFFANQKMPQEEINRRIGLHKKRVNHLTKLQRYMHNLQAANNFGNFKNLNVPAILARAKNSMDPETVAALAEYTPQNINIVKGLMQQRNNNSISAAVFGNYYNKLQINNNNTNANIRAKFMNLIKNEPEPFKSYGTRRIRQYHRN